MKNRVESRRRIAAGVTGLDSQKIGQQTQSVPPAFARWEDLLHTVRTEDHSDPVMVVCGGKSEQCRQLVDRIPFGAAQFSATLGRNATGGRGVHNQPDGQFAFFDVAFDMRTAGAGSHVPVDGTDFISGMVGADLIEIHPPASEDAPVLAGQQVFDGVPGAQLELTKALVNRVQRHGALQRC